jgi:TldD protein
MREYTDRALDTAKASGASYADIRIYETKIEGINVKNGIVQALTQDVSLGFGVRVIADGAWGFASSSELTKDEVDRVSALAVRIAKASARANAAAVDLGPPEIHVDKYTTPHEVDPFAVSLEEKVDLLLAADKEARAVEGVMLAMPRMNKRSSSRPSAFASTRSPKARFSSVPTRTCSAPSRRRAATRS